MDEYLRNNEAPSPRYNPNQPQNNLSMGGQTRVKEVPVLVKVLAVLYYISAGVAAIGLIFIIASSIFVSGRILSLLVSIIFIGGFIALLFFIARGLWKGQNWARIMVIIFCILGIISAIGGIITFSIFRNAVSAVGDNLTSIMAPLQIVQTTMLLVVIMIDMLIAGYLLFNKKVKEAFKKS